MPINRNTGQQAVPPGGSARPQVAIPRPPPSNAGTPLGNITESAENTPTRPNVPWNTVPKHGTSKAPPQRRPGQGQAGVLPPQRPHPSQAGFPPNQRLHPSQTGFPLIQRPHASQTGWPPARGYGQGPGRLAAQGRAPGGAPNFVPGRVPGQQQNLIQSLTQNFTNMNLQHGAPPTQNLNIISASQAPKPMPPPSHVTATPLPPPTGNTVAPSTYPRPPHLFEQKRNKWLENPHIFRSPFTKKTFDKGDVISVPFHLPNMDENLTLTDPNMAETAHGPVFSKRRMFIVLSKHFDDLVCLPLFSHHNRGLDAKKGRERRKEYIEIKDLVHEENGTFNRRSEHYEPLIHVHKHYPHSALLVDTICHLTEQYTFSWQWPIGHVGRLQQASYNALLGLHIDVMQEAFDAPTTYPWPRLDQNPRIRHDDY